MGAIDFRTIDVNNIVNNAIKWCNMNENRCKWSYRINKGAIKVFCECEHTGNVLQYIIKEEKNRVTKEIFILANNNYDITINRMVIGHENRWSEGNLIACIYNLITEDIFVDVHKNR